MKILNAVGTCEEDIKDDEEYNVNYYPLVDKIYNIGKLTLISKEFIDWAIYLIVLVRLNINEGKILAEKCKVMENCYQILDGNKTLYEKFKLACRDIEGVTDNVVRKCHSALIRKVINARSGLTFLLFYEKYLGHYSKKGVQTEFRKELQVLMKKSKSVDTNVKAE